MGERKSSIPAYVRVTIDTMKIKWLSIILLVFTVILFLLCMSTIQHIIYEDVRVENRDEVQVKVEVDILPPVRSTNKSFCSDKATARGPGQRVVSFSFYGPVNDVRGYFKGIDENAASFPNIYPNWTMRVYHQIKDDNPIWPIIKQLEDQLSYFDFCNISSLPTLGNFSEYMGMIWRIMPMADPLVDVFLSRDLDSRPSLRELAAVNEWLASNLSFHIMRDHPQHRAHIMAGMWGARRDLHSEYIHGITNQILKRSKQQGFYGLDQKILKEVLWPAMKGDVLQHDSYSCQREEFTENGNVRPWPTKRINEACNFIGCRVNPSIVQKNNKQIINCPLQCRPSKHTDWIFC